MRIRFTEIQNFRRLKCTHINFAEKTTLLVGANNSGKTSAMIALRYFLLDRTEFSIRDFTLANWAFLNRVGQAWETANLAETEDALDALAPALPTLDLWLDVREDESHHIWDLLPTLSWKSGLLGVRLRYEPKNINDFKTEYLTARKAATDTIGAASVATGKQLTLALWPTCLDDFLEKRLSANFTVKVYLLDPSKCISPDDGLARPQVLPKDSLPIEKDPLKKLIRINEIVAHRGFSDSGEKSGTSAKEDENGGFAATKQKRRLSEQLRSYYHRHLESSKSPTTSDIEALSAIQLAERNFNDRLESGFASSIKELEKLGYPGVTDPKLRITTKLHPTDGLRHSSAVQYEIASSSGSGVTPLHLPEDFAGLGYQNLIAMVFMLISFRDSWMRVGKAKILDTGAERDEYDGIPLLHLVLVEEPEAHLHAQVQQVFIKQAYDVLRFNEHLGESTTHTTQLVVSTHSSHVAHEADFSCLRYFRRRPALAPVNVPTTTVSDLSDVFGEEDETRRFVSRYLKAIHCDLFFADAVVLVEGQAERILVPHFIRHHFTRLSRRYVTLLEIGGSHAARFRPLIERLGLTTLIIGDLDSVALSEKKGINRWRSVKPERGRSQKSVNTVLTSWHPAMDPIDDLLGIGPEGHERSIHPDFSVYVAYQKALKLAGQNGAPDTEVIPRTFEDALIFDNQTAISAMTGYGTTTEKIRAAVLEHINEPEELADELFEILKSAEKAEFSLELLVQEDPKAIVPPTYVRLGLEWLDKELERRRQEIVKEAQDAAAAVQEAAAS